MGGGKGQILVSGLVFFPSAPSSFVMGEGEESCASIGQRSVLPTKTEDGERETNPNGRRKEDFGERKLKETYENT